MGNGIGIRDASSFDNGFPKLQTHVLQLQSDKLLQSHGLQLQSDSLSHELPSHELQDVG